MVLKNYTNEEKKALLQLVNFPRFWTLSQVLTICYWSIFNKKRESYFFTYLTHGLHHKDAIIKAKRT